MDPSSTLAKQCPLTKLALNIFESTRLATNTLVNMPVGVTNVLLEKRLDLSDCCKSSTR
eukprot:m.313633 g.313633  ORF g.313633 m.313633 type:complete len:59 (+) comp413095_c0_seq1:1-177(+)